jgi:hypothetical protein
VLFTGVAISLMDDYLDEEEYNRWAGWVHKTGRGIAVYVAVLLLAAASLRLNWAATLFAGAYAVGMWQDLARTLPSGLKGWQEAAILLVLAAFRFGWGEMASSLAVILFIQALDDMVDKRLDEETSLRNWTLDWGETEVALLAGISLFLGLALHPVKVILVILATVVIQYSKTPKKEAPV